MTTKRDDHDSLIVAAFLKRYLRDLDDGVERSLTHYQREYPGFEEIVAREYHAVADGETSALAVDRIGRYRIDRILGSGGQGEVYLATDPSLDRRVAIKVLRDLGTRSVATLRRFRREAAIAARLNHPGIATVYEIGVHEGMHFIAMQYVDGDTLGQRIAAKRRSPTPAPTLDEQRAFIAIAESVARAAHVAHEAGILHRDLKPSNIIVDRDGRAVILDFGLASELEQSTRTRSTGLFGTPDYMAPEQLTGDRVHLDRRTDVYALGVTLYECITLRRPFEAITRGALLNAILVKPPAAARTLNPAVPADLGVVLQTAMAKDRDQRYRTAADLAADLRRVREGRPVRARKPGPVSVAVGIARREPLKLIALGLALALVACGGYLLARWPEHRAHTARLAIVERRTQRERTLERACFSGTDTKALEALVREAPDTVEAVALLALAYREEHRTDDALRLLDAQRSSPPCLGRVRDFVLGRGRRTPRPNESRATPDHAAFFVRGIVALAAGRDGRPGAFERAFEHLQRAALSAPAPRRLYLLASLRAAGHCRDAAGTARITDAVTTRWPESAQGWASIAFARELAQLPDAVEAHERARALAPEDATVPLVRGHALRAVGRAADAVSAYRSALTVAPDDPRVWCWLGDAHAEAGQLTESIGAYRRALLRRPGHYPVRICLARALERDGRYEEAIHTLKKAIGTHPDRWIAHAMLAGVLTETRDFDRATAAVERALELAPTEPRVLNRCGALHLRLGAWRAAERAFTKATSAADRLRKAPGRAARSFFGLGRAKHELGEHDEACIALERALALAPRMKSAAYQLGLAHAARSDDDAAIAAFRRALEADPDDFRAAARLGPLLEANGDLRGAIEAYRRTLDERRPDPETDLRLGALLLRVGRFEESLAHYERAHRIGSHRPGWSHDTEALVTEGRRLAAHAARMERVLAGERVTGKMPAALYARMASAQSRYRVATRFWRRRFRNATAAEAAPEGSYILAARDAARASDRAGDCADASAEERDRFRILATNWLRRAFDERAREAKRWALLELLADWREDPALAALGEARLATYTLAERVRCRAFWAKLERAAIDAK